MKLAQLHNFIQCLCGVKDLLSSLQSLPSHSTKSTGREEFILAAKKNKDVQQEHFGEIVNCPRTFAHVMHAYILSSIRGFSPIKHL